MLHADGIIFDMDGTLWDASDVLAQCWTKTLARYPTKRREITGADLRAVMGKVLEEIAGIFFPEQPEAMRNEILRVCCEEECEYLRAHGAKLYDKLEETLQTLSHRHRLFIVSNCQAGYVEAFLAHYGFGHYFEDYEYAGRTGRPKGENIRLLADRNHLTAPLYVGDTMGDYEACQQAGVAFLHAAYGYGTVPPGTPALRRFSDLCSVVAP